MDPFTKDVIEAGAWIAAIVGGLVAAFKAIQEVARHRRVRAEELRWKRAQLARDVINRFKDNKSFRNAVTMLDWTGREFEVLPNRHQTITFEDLRTALRVSVPGSSFNETEVFIRDSFDELFDSMELLEHYLRTGLLEFPDIEYPMAYHINQLREHEDVVEQFLRHYGYGLALSFLERFPKHSTVAI